MRALLERQVAAAEQVHRHVERLLRVVVRLERGALRHRVIRLDQVDERLLELVLDRRRHLLLAESDRPQHVEDQHAVVGGHRATALGHDGRMFDARIVAHRLDVIDDVVGVFLQRVVHGRLEVRLRTVVVHAETAADVQVLQARALLGELAVDARRLVQGVLDDPDVGDLAAEMEVEQLEAVFHPALLQLVEPAQDFGDGQAELRAVAAGRLPAARAARRQLDAHADVRPHADLFGVLQDELELGVFLDDRDDQAAHLLGQHRHLDELGVLEAVADDRHVVFGERDDRQQLGLAAGLESEAELAADGGDFLDDLALLVDLDRVDAAVAPLVLVLRDRALERGVNLAEPVLEDVGEAKQDGGAEAAELQAIDQTLQDRPRAPDPRRMDLQVPLLVDREVALAPPRDVVELARFGQRPLRAHGVRTQPGSCAHLGKSE